MTVKDVVVTVNAAARVGQPLPALDPKDLDGKAIDLTTFKGRPVLLHGWAGWCSTCARDYAALRKLHEEKFALVGLNLDADAATARARAKKYEFPWTHAFLGGPSRVAVERLQIGAIPLYVVVAPDGKVAYRGAALSEAEKVLRAKPVK